MGKTGPQTEKPCKSDALASAPPPLRSSDFAVDSRGLGSEIGVLPNAEKADRARRQLRLHGAAGVDIGSNDKMLE
jgi:hypothetical protein